MIPTQAGGENVTDLERLQAENDNLREMMGKQSGYVRQLEQENLGYQVVFRNLSDRVHLLEDQFNQYHVWLWIRRGCPMPPPELLDAP